MTILAAADYLISVKSGSLPDNWKNAFTDFMAREEIWVVKQTKRSEKEVDIRPMIYQWEIRGDDLFLQLAAGSAQNLKPDLVMETFCQYLDLPCGDVTFGYHRLEMYADIGKDGRRELVTLESLGWEMEQQDEAKNSD